MHPQLQKLHDAYRLCRETCKTEQSSQAASGALKSFVEIALRFLETKCSKTDLISRVAGKKYFAFQRKDAPKEISRPANSSLFRCHAETVISCWDDWIQGSLPEKELAQMSYTACLAPCLALELFDRQNKKGPATFFECIIGHVFARALSCNPQKGVILEIEGMKARMTMDYLFY